MVSLSGLHPQKLGMKFTSSSCLEEHGKFSQLEFMFLVGSTLSDSGLKTMPRVLPNLYGTVTVRQILSQTVEVSAINKSQRVRSSVCLYRWLLMVRQGNSRFLASYSEMR